MNAPIDVSDIRIETRRLVLRPWRESDLEDLNAYARVEGVGRDGGLEAPRKSGGIPKNPGMVHCGEKDIRNRMEGDRAGHRLPGAGGAGGNGRYT